MATFIIEVKAKKAVGYYLIRLFALLKLPYLVKAFKNSSLPCMVLLTGNKRSVITLKEALNGVLD